MKIRILGASGAESLNSRASAFLINERTLVDAGGASAALCVDEQIAIDHVLISHCHLDHVAGLAFLSETLALCNRRKSLTVWATEEVIRTLHKSLFNDELWPNFTVLPSKEEPSVRCKVLSEGVPSVVGNLSVIAIAVNHTVPAVGFVIHDGRSGFVYSGDTGPTSALWQTARNIREIRAVFLECSYPNRLDSLAKLTKHLTPKLLQKELKKAPLDVPVLVFHIKPHFRDEIVKELEELHSTRIMLLEESKTYELV
jgi:cAMP phosphodiesterase